jgi:hypothetical protein
MILLDLGCMDMSAVRGEGETMPVWPSRTPLRRQ